MKYGIKLFVTGLITMCAYLFLTISSARAVTFTVTKTADTNDGVCTAGDCSLREAIFAANDLAGADTIVFASNVFAAPQPVQQIFLSLDLPELSVEDDLTINGPGARQLLINGNSDDRIFLIKLNHSVSIKDLAMLNGNAKVGNIGQGQPSDCTGGGIKNFGNLTLARVRLYLNQADCQGGGIFNQGTLTVLYSVISNNYSNQYGGAVYTYSGSLAVANSTLSDNEAQFSGGGIWIDDESEFKLNNATISHNKAGNEGGGILAQVIPGVPSNKRMRNTIVANNIAPNYKDILGRFDSQGSNLIRVNDANVSFPPGSPNNFGDYVGTFATPLDPMLGPLQNNGGLSNTRALLPGSPAIDKGDSCVAWVDCAENKPPSPLVYDQRFTGFNRKNGASVDIGAYEAEPSTTSIIGSVIYAITQVNQSQKTVPGVTVSATGASSASDTTDSSGNYSIENLAAGGQYTVTSTKSGANGITAFDATLVLRHVAANGQGVNALSANQQKAADTSSDNSVTAFDATQILRYVAANAPSANTGQTGNWKFTPPSHNYQSLSNSLAGENFEAVLVGEVSGDWAAPANPAASESEVANQDETAAKFATNETEISLPINASVGNDGYIVVPVELSNYTGKTISSFTFDVTFNPNVLQPDFAEPVDSSGTLSQELMIVSDTAQPGRIGIAAADVNANGGFSTGGTLIKLRFRVVRAANDLKKRSAALRFGQTPIIEDESGAPTAVKRSNGSVRLYSGKIDTPALPTLERIAPEQ
jgi:CSLREA domain-containing protein